MIRLKSSGTMMICLLLAAAFFPLSADTSAGPDSGDAGDQLAVDAIAADPILTDEFNSCPDLPASVVPVDYWILATSAGIRDDRGPVSIVTDQSSNPANAALSDRQLINSEARYEEIFGVAPAGVDWTTSRILIVEEFTSYKFGELNSDFRLSGVYISGNSIIVSETSSHYGPCQGIAQDPSWYSFDARYLVLVLPREPANIEYHFCSVGDCPPNIP